MGVILFIVSLFSNKDTNRKTKLYLWWWAYFLLVLLTVSFTHFYFMLADSCVGLIGVINCAVREERRYR
jgi:hypothetical protein